MTTPTVTETRRHGGRVGERVELARYTVSAGERILYGQRVDGVVRFLPTEGVVLVAPQGLSEDDAQPVALVGYRASPHALAGHDGNDRRA
jgi:hypothetical protein